MRIDTATLQAVAAEIREALGDDEDMAAFWDTLDGETSAIDMIDDLLAQKVYDEALADGLTNYIQDASARRARLLSRADAYKAALGRILTAVGERKVERPLATVSLRKGSESVSIHDADAVPSQLCKTTVTPDKAAIKKQLKAGEDVPGAELVTGPESVMVRTT